MQRKISYFYMVLTLSLVFLFVPSTKVWAKNNIEPKTQTELATEFAYIVGKVTIFDLTLKQLSNNCGMNLALPESLMLDLDYTFRKRTGLPFSEMTSLLADAKDAQALAQEDATKMLNDMGGCKKEALIAIQQDASNTLYENALAESKKLGPVYGFPESRITDREIMEIFSQKVNSFTKLPNEEQKSLAWDLVGGRYEYLFGRYVDVPKDYLKALEIMQHLANVTQSPKYHYQLGVLLKDKDKELAAYKKAATQGHSKAQIWLGTYYSCIKNQQKASRWLNKAKQNGDLNDANDANDVLLEIRDLGKPTNCRSEWLVN